MGQENSTVKVRFAPSPTGYLHIGGARTALFNWMYAKAQKGKFILRIEDTDQKRSKKEFENEILESMQWLGLDWDELFYQRERFCLYQDYAEKLVKEGKAYKKDQSILLNMEKQHVKFYDIIRGEINFDTSNFIALEEDGSKRLDNNGAPVLKDEVLIKADGTAAYSFCCVIDDALMQITHVIRGEDHISNTPKQIIMYNAMGFPLPKFAHLPLIMGEDGSRLSKRTNAVAVSDYKKQGFLPEALVNYLVLLGWSPGNNQEVMRLKSVLNKFSLKKINKASAVFSMDKLKWLNGEYIKNMPSEELVELLHPLLRERNYIQEDFDGEQLIKVINLYKKRMPTLLDFLDRTAFVFVDDIDIADDLKSKILAGNRNKEFSLLIESLSHLDCFDARTTEKAFREVISQLGIKSSQLVHPIRLLLTASTVGPGLFETMEVLGKEKTLKRLKGAFV